MKKLTSVVSLGLMAFSLNLSAQSGNGKRALLQPQQTDEALPGTVHNATHADRRNGHKTLQATIYLAKYDSAYYWVWDSNSMDWSGNQAWGKYVNFVYDAHNNLTSETLMGWNGTTWVNEYLYTLTYNAGNETLINLVQSWNGSAWANWNMHSYTYDANNNQLTSLYQTWSGSAWVNSSLGTYTYNANNKTVTSTNQNWISSAWVNTDMYTDSYDANNNEIGYVAQTWNGSAWVNDYQYMQTYDANNNDILSVEQGWNGSTWVNSSQSIYTYNANNVDISEIDQGWNGSAWVNNYQYTYTYDANNNLTNSLTQIWNSSAWGNSYLTVYTYNANHKATYYLSQNWNGTSWINAGYDNYTYDADNLERSSATHTYNTAGTKVISGDSAYYYFTDILGVNDVKGGSETVKVYPNPSNGRFCIALSHPALDAGSQPIIEVYNVLGENVMTEILRSAQGDNLIDLSSQPGGIYFYRVIANSGNIIGDGKIVIQK